MTAGLAVLLTGSTCLLYLSGKWPNYSTPGLVLRVIGSVVLSVVAGLVVLVYS